VPRLEAAMAGQGATGATAIAPTCRRASASAQPGGTPCTAASNGALTAARAALANPMATHQAGESPRALSVTPCRGTR